MLEILHNQNILELLTDYCIIYVFLIMHYFLRFLLKRNESLNKTQENPLLKIKKVTVTILVLWK